MFLSYFLCLILVSLSKNIQNPIHNTITIKPKANAALEIILSELFLMPYSVIYIRITIRIVIINIKIPVRRQTFFSSY